MDDGRKRSHERGEREQHCGAGSRVRKPEECEVCFMVFEETERRPRTLPCGHTFCSRCILKLINETRLSCPTCHAQHPALSVDDFPISYLTEAFIKNLRATMLGQASAAVLTTARSATATAGAESPHKNSKAISKRLWSVLQEEKDNCISVLKECRTIQSQLARYHSQLAGWKGRHKRLQSSLMRLLHKTGEYQKLIEQEESQVLALKGEGEAEEKEVEAMQGHLDTLTTAGEAYMALDSCDHCTDKAKTWIKKCWERFPNAELVSTSLKVLEATEAVVTAAEKAVQRDRTEVGATAAPATLGDPATTIQQRAPPPPVNKKPAAEKKSPTVVEPPVIRARDLQNMKESTRKLVEAGRVVAVHQDGGRCRSSKITVQGGRAYLHPLQDQPPPPEASTLQMSEVVPAAPPCVVFLDLAWPGSPPQRVHIRLSPDTPLGRQFLLLCTGRQGPCYQGSKLLQMVREWNGRQGEWVKGGDYQSNDGEGGAPLLPHLHRGEYEMSGKAGAVWGWWKVWGVWDGPMAAQFGITTRDLEGGGEFVHVFGAVESGLPALRTATNHRPITEVTVVDCGVVLSS